MSGTTAICANCGQPIERDPKANAPWWHEGTMYLNCLAVTYAMPAAPTQTQEDENDG